MTATRLAARTDRDRVPVPAGFRLVLDATARQLADDLWFGGAPPRVMRMTATGRRAMAELLAGPVGTAESAALARRLTDAGLAHPVPPPIRAPADVTVVVPVRDRAVTLGRCLAALGHRYPVLVVDDGSCDPEAVASVAHAHGARLVRRTVNGGPAAARNTGLAAIRSPFVAFVDSDCEATGDWIGALLAHLADPLVAAAAPRITALAGSGWSGRYTRACGSLDLGDAPARVAPFTRVTYVPTAALVVRRAALDGTPAFEESLRVGEDVDLVWRLHDAGWRVRYDPTVTVAHREPARWRDLLARRFRYGTSAAQLGLRHPERIAPLVLHPWPGVTLAGLLAARPSVVALGLGGAVTATAHTLRRAGVPRAGVVRATLRAAVLTWLGAGRYATQFGAPLIAALTVVAPGATCRRTARRLAFASLLLGPPLQRWRSGGTGLDPVRFVVGFVADEIAYGAGVWTGCARSRTLAPVRPVVGRKAVRIDAVRRSRS